MKAMKESRIKPIRERYLFNVASLWVKIFGRFGIVMLSAAKHAPLRVECHFI
jgi:hypothetical protein